MHRKEKKMRENHGKKGIIYAENLVKALLCAYLVTGMFLLILALLLYKAGLSEENVNLGTRKTYADIAATILDILGVENNTDGASFKKEIMK